MSDEHHAIIDALIDAMTALHEIEAQAKAVRERLEVLSVALDADWN